MKRQLKQYRYQSIYRGMNIEILVAALYKKDIAKILDLSLYMVKTWVSDSGNLIEECKKNPYQRFCIESGGEIQYAFPELRGKVVKYQEMINAIDNYRTYYPTYHHTMERAEFKKATA